MAGFANRVSFDGAGTSLAQPTVEAAIRELMLLIDSGPYAMTSGGGRERVVSEAAGASYNVDLTQGNVFDLTLTDNTIFTLSGAPAGVACSWSMVLTQDGTGNRVPTWFANAKWPLATPATLSVDPTFTDILTFFTLDGGTTIYGFMSGQRMG